MVYSIARSVNYCLIALVAVFVAMPASAQGCFTVQPKSGATIPQITQDADGKLVVRVTGPFEIAGDPAGFSISGSGNEMVLQRTVAQGVGASITRLANDAVKICTDRGPASATAIPMTPPVIPGTPAGPSTPNTVVNSRSVVDSTSAPNLGGTPVGANAPPSAGATPKKSCLQTSTNCDIVATLSDIAPPESPAFSVLGIAPKNVSRPTSPSDFATSVISSFDQQGNFQAGTALDAAPFLLLANHMRLMAHYTDTWWVRPLARTTISYGTTKGASDADKSVRLAFGARIVLYDEADPRLLFGRCVQEFTPDPNRDIEVQKRELREKRDQCVALSAKHIWNATSLVIAGAPSWISTTGRTADFMLNGAGYWTSAALRLSDWGQVTGEFRRRTGEQIPLTSAANSPFTLQDSTVGGGLFRFGKGVFNGDFEGVYVRTRRLGVVDSHPEFGFGLERKLTDNLFLEIQYRYANGGPSGTSGLLSNLKWSFNKQPQFVPSSSDSSAIKP